MKLSHDLKQRLVLTNIALCAGYFMGMGSQVILVGMSKYTVIPTIIVSLAAIYLIKVSYHLSSVLRDRARHQARLEAYPLGTVMVMTSAKEVLLRTDYGSRMITLGNSATREIQENDNIVKQLVGPMVVWVWVTNPTHLRGTIPEVSVDQMVDLWGEGIMYLGGTNPLLARGPLSSLAESLTQLKEMGPPEPVPVYTTWHERLLKDDT